MRVLALAVGLLANIAIFLLGLVSLTKNGVLERRLGHHYPEPEDDDSGAKVSNTPQRIPPGS